MLSMKKNIIYLASILVSVSLMGCKTDEESEFFDTCKLNLNLQFVLNKNLTEDEKDYYKNTIGQLCECTLDQLQNEFEIRGLGEEQSYRAISASIKTQDISYLNPSLTGSYNQATNKCSDKL